MTEHNEFLGKRVNLMFSDPWDAVTETGAGPFRGRVVNIVARADHKEPAVVIELDAAIRYRSRDWLFMMMTARHEGKPLLKYDQQTPANLTWVDSSSPNDDEIHERARTACWMIGSGEILQ